MVERDGEGIAVVLLRLGDDGLQRLVVELSHAEAAALAVDLLAAAGVGAAGDPGLLVVP